MAAATQLLDFETASPAEIVATFSNSELVAASLETSNIYNGLVLARALLIVQERTRCFAIHELGARIGVAKTAVYRWAKGGPVTLGCYERSLRLLAMELAERGVR